MKLLAWLTAFWNQRKGFIIIDGIALVMFLLTFMKGCQYGKAHKICPRIETKTVFVHDTVTHRIVDRFPYYVYKTDTVIYESLIPMDVDTNLILKEYFAKHIIDRKWENDTLTVNIRDVISRNQPVSNLFKYNIKIPFTTITNTVDQSVHYQSYLYIGGSVPINKFDYSSIDLTLALPKWSAGVGYMPGQNTFVVKAEIKLIQFKSK